jgi:hypothetical protein
VVAGGGGLANNPPPLFLLFPHRWGFSYYVIDSLLNKIDGKEEKVAGWRV